MLRRKSNGVPEEEVKLVQRQDCLLVRTSGLMSVWGTGWKRWGIGTVDRNI